MVLIRTKRVGIEIKTSYERICFIITLMWKSKNMQIKAPVSWQHSKTGYYRHSQNVPLLILKLNRHFSESHHNKKWQQKYQFDATHSFFYIHWQRECKNDPFCGHLSTFSLKSEVPDNEWNLYTALWATNLSRNYIFMSISHSSFKIMLIYIIANNTTFCIMF